MISVVTSCSAQGWREYGQECVRTFHEFWPLSVNLHIVSEDDLGVKISDFAHRPVWVWKLCESNKAAADFYQRHRDNVRAHGRDLKSRSGYSYRHDAYKFSKKVFAVDTVLQFIQKLTTDRRAGWGRLLWLDADTVTFARVPLDMFERMPPRGHALAHLARPNYHSECGFIGYDLDHPQAVKFIHEFAALYSSDQVFKLKEWHDSWVFDYLIKALGVRAYPIPHTSVSHPFVRSELGRYMDHKKGARKTMLHSPEHPVLGKLLSKQQQRKPVS